MQSEVAPLKRGRGRPRKDNVVEITDQEFASVTESSLVAGLDEVPQGTQTETTDEQLDNPALFPEMDYPRIPKLEARAKLLASERDTIKAHQQAEKDLAEECLLIMADHGLKTYNKYDVNLAVSLKPTLKVSIG